MALLPPRKGNTRRRPGSKGLVMGDMVRGVERVRAWPRKRGKSKTQQQKEQTEAFRQAQWAFKYQDAAVIETITEMVAGTPLMPRDLFLMMVSGRAFAFQHEGEPIQYSMAALQDVSESLDVIDATPGHMLVRGPQFWEGQPVPGGGGGTSAWTLLDDKTITTPISRWPVSVAGFNDLMFILMNVTTSSSGNRVVEVSVDGGVTWLTTLGDYTFFSTAGVLANTVGVSIHGTASSAARGGVSRIYNAQNNGLPKVWNSMINTGALAGFIAASTAPITNVRYGNTAGNMTGGRLITLGR